MKFHETCSSITCTQYILDVTHACQAQNKILCPNVIPMCSFFPIGQSQQNSQKDHESYFLEKITRKVVRWEVLSMQMHGLKSLKLNFCLYISSKFIVCQAFKLWNYCPNFQCRVKPKAPKVEKRAHLI
jgi:hypothetical protein